MTDLSHILPHFSTQPFAHLIPSLERSLVSTIDLLTLEPGEVAKRARVPAGDVGRLAEGVRSALGKELGVGLADGDDRSRTSDNDNGQEKRATLTLRQTGTELFARWKTVSTLDGRLDHALGGGVPTGCITEITGESGAGKTQFLLTLLLSAQLPSLPPPPSSSHLPIQSSDGYGLSRSTLYISTESSLPTTRLAQILATHPLLSSLPEETKPSLDRVISIITPDLESQDHILRYQVPVAIKRYDIGLVVLDSVAANFRAEFDGAASKTANGNERGMNMATRSAELVKLGQLLRRLARDFDIAIVVANQVADRFVSPDNLGVAGLEKTGMANGHGNNHLPAMPKSQESPLAHRSTAVSAPPPPPPPPLPPPLFPPLSGDAATQTPSSSVNFNGIGDIDNSHNHNHNDHDPLTLDHQQRWFTGWGDDLRLLQQQQQQQQASSSFGENTTPPNLNLKTPSLGLVWTEQISCRIVLILDSSSTTRSSTGAQQLVKMKKEKKRWFKVVFGSWCRPSGVVKDDGGSKEVVGMVEYEIWGGGVRSVV